MNWSIEVEKNNKNLNLLICHQVKKSECIEQIKEWINA